MPPKSRFSNENIIDAAFNVLRGQGWGMVSARSIAKELNASTSPIYTYLKSMKNLEEELVKKAMAVMRTFQTKRRTGDPYLDMGIGYVMFAKEERNLFRFLHEEKFLELYMRFEEKNMEYRVQQLSEYAPAKKFTPEQKRILLFTGYVFVHGLADLLNKSFHLHSGQLMKEKDITEFLSLANKNFWAGTETIFKKKSK